MRTQSTTLCPLESHQVTLESVTRLSRKSTATAKLLFYKHHRPSITLSRSAGTGVLEPLELSVGALPGAGGGTFPYAAWPSTVLSFIGCALNGRPDGGGGIVSSERAGGMYTGCGGIGTALPQPSFISKSIIILPRTAKQKTQTYTHAMYNVHFIQLQPASLC